MEKKLIDIGKLKRVTVSEDDSKACYNCILDNVCYGEKYSLLNDRDRAIIKKNFRLCIDDDKSYQLKDGEKIEDDEIV